MTADRPNFVVIMTDTQPTWMVGAYGNPTVDTPNLDLLAASGVQFDRAYTATPLCTPARGAIFSGLHPQVNGAWTNNVAPQTSVPMMGEIFRHLGYRAGYTGKWHLDGSAYFGDGQPGGGFEPEWWYDGKRYAEDIGPDLFAQYRQVKTPDELRRAGFTVDNVWGHRVANRAIDFLEEVGADPFVLTVSFDEPHGPFVCPPEYWEKFADSELPIPDRVPVADDAGIPSLQRLALGELPDPAMAADRATLVRHLGCNSYIDREIGRVIDAVDALHGENTVIIYTTDHGDMAGSHGLTGKGPMMYEDVCKVPFLVRAPGRPAGIRVDQVVSHLDILPTMLELAGVERPEALQGRSFAPLLTDPDQPTRDDLLVSFGRFAVNHDSFGGFFPIRCLVTRRYKLAVNLLDTDELYDLDTDPAERRNRIDDPALATVRDELHDRLLAELDRIRDPFRGAAWANRPWRTTPVAPPPYYGAPQRPAPAGFPFQPTSVSARTQQARR